MGGAAPAVSGPDFAQGIALAEIPAEGTICGRAGDTPVFLSRFGGAFHAVTAICTHYSAGLSEGVISGETVRCPWHHACFSLRSGEALSAPAFDPLQQWSVEVTGGMVFVRAQSESKSAAARIPRSRSGPQRVVIVGGGAAGFAAAEMLRRKGFAGELTMLSEDSDLPCDRPNLSKDYLAGTAPEEWLSLKDAAFYRERGIDVRLRTTVAAIEPSSREVHTTSGADFRYDALLLATGAEPIRPQVPGLMRDDVYTLRTPGDARAIITASAHAKAVVIAGASFIGLEVAASLRARGLEVHVVAPERVPMERTLGAEIGALIRNVHEANGVHFHLGRKAERFDGNRLLLSDGDGVAGDFLILGIGVRPAVSLARETGLAIDNGIIVDEYLQTSAPAIFAAGDVARYPDHASGERIRVEHWVVAQRQGQIAALNILGERTPYRAVPFFWSNHYDLAIRYVGYAAGWDSFEVDGSVAGRDCTVRYIVNGRLAAAASIGRDKQNLETELALERGLTHEVA